MTDVPSDSTGAPTPDSIDPSTTPESASPTGFPDEYSPALTPKPNKGRYVAIAAIVAALGGGAAIVATSSNDTASVSAGTPIGAVESMISLMGEGRVTDLIRSEFPWMDDFGGIDDTTFSTAGLEDGKIDGLTLEGIDLQYDVEEVGDTLAIVSITGGSFRAGVDVSKLPDEYRAALPAGAVGISYKDDFPVAVIASQMCPAGSSGQCDPSVLKLVTVDNGAGWRVSWMHTGIFLSTDATLDPGSEGGASSPEAMTDAIEAAILSGDPNAAIDLLDPQEFSWARDFRFEYDQNTTDDALALTIDATIQDQDSTSAWMHIDRFEATGSENGQPKSATFDGDCLFEDGDRQGCISDLRELDLGPLSSFSVVLNQIADEGLTFGLVNREGRWFLSLARTIEPLTPALEAASREFEDLIEDCKTQAAADGPPTSPECALFGMGPLGFLQGMTASVGSSESYSEEASLTESSY